MRRSTGFPLLLVALTTTLACSSSDDPTGPQRLAGTFTATIDGDAWVGTVDSGSISLNGADFYFTVLASAAGMDIGLAVTTSQSAPATLDLTTGSTGAEVREGGETWYAVGMGGSGTLTLTTMTADRATGTFEFVATPVGGSAAGGTRTVTNGHFDLTF